MVYLCLCAYFCESCSYALATVQGFLFIFGDNSSLSSIEADDFRKFIEAYLIVVKIQAQPSLRADTVSSNIFLYG